MVPAAFGHEIGGEFRAPMAVAVIGGLMVSTVLSLVVVPACHVLIADLGDAVKRLAQKMPGGEAAVDGTGDAFLESPDSLRG
jgi:hypothetical protein